MLERIAPNGIAGSLDSTYLSGLKTIVNYITGKGAYALIERVYLESMPYKDRFR